MPTLLLTYFGPFEGVPVNPTRALAQQTAQALAESAPHIQVETRELPVEYAGSSRELARLIQDIKPDYAISLGVAAGRDKVSLERVAINLDSASIADNAGDLAQDRPISEQGPAAYFASLPTRPICEKLTAQGLPVELSYTAGSYVCNHVFYELMRLTGSQIPAGFIHVPLTQEAARADVQARADTGGVEGESLPALPQELVLKTLEEAILLTVE